MRASGTWIIACFVVILLSVRSHAQEDITIVGPDEYSSAVNPLTGLTVADPTTLQRRPLIVKISNYPPFVRPQSGLMEADIVWEHLLSGGVTRFSAVFLSQDSEHVGPIRSLRLFDFELVRIYRALSAYSGMAQGTRDVLATDALMSRRIVGGVDPCPALCRFPREGIALEHTLYGDTLALRELAQERERDMQPEPIYGMAFSENTPLGGTPLEGLQILYRETTIDWQYERERGIWARSQDGEAHLDATSGEQITATNVVVVEEEHTVQPVVSPGYWGPGDFAFSVNFIGSGRAYLLRDGQYFIGEWRRETRRDPLTFYSDIGTPLLFKPGNTFFALVPRWVDGYSLRFSMRDTPSVSVDGTIGVSMRLGPGEGYISPDVAYPGDTFTAIGRNNGADWVQLLSPDERVVWLPADTLNVNRYDLTQLPVVRPSNEP